MDVPTGRCRVSLPEVVVGVVVANNELLYTCPSGEHRGILVAEANSRGPLEDFAAEIGLGENTVHKIDQMRFPA